MEIEADLAIETPRLAIRELRAEDFADIHAFSSDAETALYMPWGPNSEMETRDFLRRAVAMRRETPRREYHFALVVKEAGRIVGNCGLSVRRNDPAQGEIGYVMHRDWRGRGLATEAAGALLDFAFGSLGLHRVVALCDPRNAASARVLEKAGLRREGHSIESAWIKGEWRDELLFAILHREWRDSRIG
ncbi:MAG: Spermidine N(1)-acetyltransferase [candidate division BRC1 bacterium ADurb.BinA364]|nr:MAG: Spermidine N(1)-acetyltransferase [candidate division BRC1 bacterium ADurb.BinA364]